MGEGYFILYKTERQCVLYFQTSYRYFRLMERMHEAGLETTMDLLGNTLASPSPRMTPRLKTHYRYPAQCLQHFKSND